MMRRQTTAMVIITAWSDHQTNKGEQANHYRKISLEKLPALRQAIEGGQIVCQKVSGSQTDPAPGMLAGKRQQILVPICRETNTIGVLLLESSGSEPYTEEMVSFLTRLSDHAAIAIANAQLYEESKGSQPGEIAVRLLCGA